MSTISDPMPCYETEDIESVMTVDLTGKPVLVTRFKTKKGYDKLYAYMATSIFNGTEALYTVMEDFLHHQDYKWKM